MPLIMQRLERLESALTSKYWSFIFLTPETCPRKLIQALSLNLPHVESESWLDRLSWGGTFINGKPVYEDQALIPPCRIEYYEPKDAFDSAGSNYPHFDPDQIVFEDEQLLAVFKPARLPCLPVREQRLFNLRNYLDRYLQGKKSSARVHMPSRLDTSVCGLVLASKDESFHNKLQILYQNRRMHKLYIMRTDRIPNWDEITVDAPITRDPAHAVLRKVADYGGKPAETIFNVLGKDEQGTVIISARPLTGRTHQIRLHALHAGIPILGDNFYCGTPASELNLMSYKVAFTHPNTRGEIEITVPSRLFPAWIDRDFEALYTKQLE
ncbi:MAG: hypothetical protein DCC75_02515 [Proteobacteria bacterium]|nr:MAG: hypothetical protein DCC75_02515 [Pseudomonadota bacterium]